MTNGHTRHAEAESEAPHSHEAPDGALVDYHVFATIRSAAASAAIEAPSAWADSVAGRVEAYFASLDRLTDLARRTIAGEVEARRLFVESLESTAVDEARADHASLGRSDAEDRSQQSQVDDVDQAGHEHAHEREHDRHRDDVVDHGGHHPADHRGHGDKGRDADVLGDSIVDPLVLEAAAAEELDAPLEWERPRTLGIDLRAVRELFLAAALAGEDVTARARYAAAVKNTLGSAVALLDHLHRYATLGLDGSLPRQSIGDVLDQLARADLTALLSGQRPPPHFLEINPVMECLDALREATIGSESAFAEWDDDTDDSSAVTSLIGAISPASVCVGEQVTLLPNAGSAFPTKRPGRYQVLLQPCGTSARIIDWASDAITVEVPATASSGCVWVARAASSSGTRATRAAEGQALNTLAACLGHFGIGSGSLGRLTIDPARFCRPSQCRAGAANYLRVRHPPEIISFVARDPAGRAIGSDGVEAGTPVTVSWNVASDDDGQLVVRTRGAQPATNQPPRGSLLLTAAEMCVDQQVTLEATNSCGTTVADLDIGTHRLLSLTPSQLTLDLVAPKQLTIRSSCPVAADLTVHLVAKNPDQPAAAPRVTVPATVDIPAGSSSVTVQITAATGGNQQAFVAGLVPGQAAAVITATAAGHAAAAVGVWVEPPRGQSKVVQPGGPASASVAVHMALLRDGRVLMFSADDADFGHIDKVDTRVWDPSTNSLVEPSFPYPTHKNLFCAGQCLLPDGRVLVIGGHAIFAGGSAAKMTHTFDPLSNSWTRHGEMQKDRWYPTCLTLADGRVLISSGSEAGGPPTIFKGVVRDAEIFNPATNGLTRFPNVYGDISMYPYMFVLPGQLVFFHSRNVSWLFTAGPGAWSPTNGTWSGPLPMNSPTTRTYPGMAACALLPLLPEEGYATRILMAGGGGAREHDLNHATVATSTAEIFDAAGSSGTWRTTNATRAPLAVRAPRFMSDAVLLPDGTVLIINGAAVGKADDAHVSVMFAELFDPVTETIRPLTDTQIPRRYHGTALLLPDGRVAVAGHTKEFNKPPVEVDRKEIEIISPPYLFRGPRPRLTHVGFSGTRVGYGSEIMVACDRPSEVRRAALIRAGSVTHQLNTDQRYVGLEIVARTTSSLTVKAPPDGFVAPPGYYLLFLVDTRGVPSVGRFLPLG